MIHRFTAEDRPLGAHRPTIRRLAFITLLAASIRLYISPSIALWYDEACTLLLSDYVSVPLRIFNPDYNIDPPLFLIIAWFWSGFLDLFPVSPGTYVYDYLLRVPTILFSTLAVPVTYFAGKALLVSIPGGSDSRGAAGLGQSEDRALLFASFLVAISPFQLYYAHELRSYSLFGLLGIISLWLFARALHHNRPTSWALLTFVLVLAFWNHFFAAWFVICIDVFLLITWKTSRHLYRTWAFWHVVVGLACIPPLYNAYQTSEIVSQITGQWIPPPDIKSLFITFKTFFAGYSPRSWAYWPIFLVASALCLLSIYGLRRRPRTLLLLLIWTFLPMVLSFLFWRTRTFSYYEIRLFIACGISAAILVGFGWSLLPRIVRVAALLAILTFTFYLSADTYAQRFHPLPEHRLGVRHKAHNRTAANYIEAQGTAQESIFHLSHVTLPAFRIYLPDFTQRHICLGQEQLSGFIGALPNLPLWQHLDMVPVPLANLDLNISSFWVVVSWWEPFNKPGDLTEVENRLRTQFVETDRREFFALTVVHFQKRSPT